MSRIISVLLFACFVAAKAHFEFPLTLDTNPDILSNEIPSNDEETKPKINYRLPDAVIPKKYTLKLSPYIDVKSAKNLTFDGTVIIELDVKALVDGITLHSRNLTFENTDVKLEFKDKTITNLIVKDDSDRDFKIIKSSDVTLEQGAYRLTINYQGELNDEKRGFYRSSYINDKGEKVWLAATHFEPVGARRAFPCFDEPQLKAKFDVSIVHDKKYSAISNTKVKTRSEPKDGLVTTTFDTTPPMSTYLLAFVVSDFENKTNSDKNFTVFARPNAIKNADLAVKTGEKLLKELEKFTGIKFEINKMDQAAIPDFAAGAMENWGLVLYREKSLLFDEKVLTTAEKQSIVETIAHEFAHQWFGDLVSPKWWKYLWLNEGFANFFQSYITEKVEPNWRSIDQSVVKSIQTTAFNFDSGSTTHPINEEVESPKEISAIFDSISYQKGGAIIRMMQHFLKESTFQKGLQLYLKQKTYGSATSDDLFEALTEGAKPDKINVKSIMDTWVNFKGYPVISVNRDYNGKSIEIKQERFFSYNASEEEKKDKHLWDIPINYVTEAKPDFNVTTPDFWFKDPAMNKTIDVNPKHWFILNKQQTGFYRVNYDEQNWNLIIDYLNSSNGKKIHVLNRAQLINDALAFVQQEKLNLKTLLHITAHLKNESDYVAWYPGFKALSWLNGKLINSKHYSTFKEYVLNTTKHLLDTVGLEETKKDEHLTKLNRIAAIKWACSLGHSPCISAMQQKLEAWINNPANNSISPDLKEVTFCHGLRTAKLDFWKKVLEKCIKTTDADEKQRLTVALGCSTQKEILEYYLNYTVEVDSPLNDTFAVAKSIIENSEIGLDTVIDFAIKRFITILLKVKNETSVTNFFSYIGERITTKAQIEKLKASESVDIPQRITKKGIQFGEKNFKWLNDNDKALTSWADELKTKANTGGGVGTIAGSLGLILSLLIITFGAIN